MKLINIDCLTKGSAASCHPFLIPESVVLQAADNRGIVRTKLRGKPIGIAVIQKRAVLAINPVFVSHGFFGLRDSNLPEIPVIDFLHGSFLPLIKIANQRNPQSVRSKGAEGGSMAGNLCA